MHFPTEQKTVRFERCLKSGSEPAGRLPSHAPDQFHAVNRATLLASLREKYGKETVAFAASVDNSSVTTDDRKIDPAGAGTEADWFFDERAARVTDTAKMRANNCADRSWVTWS